MVPEKLLRWADQPGAVLRPEYYLARIAELTARIAELEGQQSQGGD